MSKIKKFINFKSVACLTMLMGLVPTVALAQWAGSERSGACRMTNLTHNFTCRFGPYDSSKDIKGFYVNPTGFEAQDRLVPVPKDIPIRYRTRGTSPWSWGNWVSTSVRLGATSGNYRSFGSGVRSFEFEITRPPNNINTYGNRLFFNMNYSN